MNPTQQGGSGWPLLSPPAGHVASAVAPGPPAEVSVRRTRDDDAAGLTAMLSRLVGDQRLPPIPDRPRASV